MAKLKSCIDSIHALKQLTYATFNVSENTQRIVKFVMNGRGTIDVFREKGRRECDLVINYTNELKGIEKIKSDELVRHCNRVMLLLHSKNRNDSID